MGSGTNVSESARKRGVASVSIVTLSGLLWINNCFSITENMGSGASVSETSRKKKPISVSLSERPKKETKSVDLVSF